MTLPQVWKGPVRPQCTARSSLPNSSCFNCCASLFPQQSTVDKLIRKTNLALVVGTHSWRDQFMEAITVSAGEGDISKSIRISTGFMQPGMTASPWSVMLSCGDPSAKPVQRAPLLQIQWAFAGTLVKSPGGPSSGAEPSRRPVFKGCCSWQCSCCFGDLMSSVQAAKSHPGWDPGQCRYLLLRDVLS